MANSMLSCNEVIILLDCHRGFNEDRHMGNVKLEIENLIKYDLIEKATGVEECFDFILTKSGHKLTKHLLNEAVWKMVFIPGSTNV